MPMTKEERRIRNSLSMEIGDTNQIVERTDSTIQRSARRGGFFGGGGAIISGSVDGGVVEHHDTTGLLDDDHTQYVHNSIDRSITADHSFSGDVSFSANPPFAVSSSNLVTNLNADKLDGYDESAFFRLTQAEVVTGQPAFNGGETGTSAPFTVDSTDVVTNLNADKWDGYEFADYLDQAVKIGSSPTHVDLTLSNPSSIYGLNHDSFTGFVADEHIDWKDTTENFLTTGTVGGGTASLGFITATTTANTKLRLAEDGSNYVDFIVNDTGQLTISPSGNSTMFSNASNLGSVSYVSGFAGSGWQLSKDAANEYTAEFDNLTVRGTMSVYELLIQQIRASNGSLIIGSADKVVEVELVSGSTYKFTVESDEDSGSGGEDFIHFKEDDLIIAQKWAGTSGDPPYDAVKKVRATVTEDPNSSGTSLTAKEFEATLYSGDSVSSSDMPLDFVRIGSTSDADRQGGIYLTSEDSGAPFIDIFDDVDSWADWRLPAKTKARLGRLDGINYDDGSGGGFDIPDTYGLFSKDVYLIGKITATSGFIGDNDTGWEIDANGFTNVGTTTTTRIGVGTGGYGNSSQGFWVDGSGRLSLGDKLTWNGSALAIKGTIQLSDGTTITDSGLNWRGAWAHSTAYSINDGVSYAESSYICISAHTSTNDTNSSTGNPASATNSWNLMAEQGADGDLFATSSSTSISIPTSHPTSRTITVGTGLSWTAGQSALVAKDNSNKFVGEVTAYNSVNGSLSLDSSSHTGSGTYDDWEINLEGAPGPQGDTGTAGDSVDIIFKRSDGQPDTPAASSGTPTGEGWYTDVDSVPAGSNPIWSSVGTKAGGVTNFTWQDPVKLEGQDGSQGDEGLSVAEVTVFQRSSTSLNAPTSGSFEFGDPPTLTAPSGWSATVPAGTDPCYVTSAVAVSTSSTGTDTFGSGDWSTPVIGFEDGDDGADSTVAGPTGPGGQFTKRIYKNAATTPSNPANTGGTYGTPAAPSGWSFTPGTPSSSQFTWHCIADYTAAGGFQGWTTPARHSGEAGPSGNNAKAVKLTSDVGYVFAYDVDGANPVPDAVDLEAVETHHSGTVYYDFLKDGNSVQNNSGNNAEIYVFDAPDNNFAQPIQFTINTREGGSSGTIIATDSITIYGVQDGDDGTNGLPGDDAHTAFLTNQAHTVAADLSGESYSLSGAGGTFKMFDGAVDKTGGDTTYYAAASGTSLSEQKNGLTFTINQSTGVYTLSGGSWDSSSEDFTVRGTHGGVTATLVYSISKAIAGQTGADNQDFDFLGATESTIPSTYDGLFMGEDFMGYVTRSGGGTPDWRTYLDDDGKFYFKGSTANILSWQDDSLTINHSSNYIGFTTNGDADVGSVPAFFAGALARDGEDALISFGADGKIRGSGVYRQTSQWESSKDIDWAIEQSRLFGDGADGTFIIKRNDGYSTDGAITFNNLESGTDLKPKYRVKDGDAGTDVNVAPGNTVGSYTGGEDDVCFTVLESGFAVPGQTKCYLRMERDVYAERIEFDTSYPGDIEIQTNGYRLFVRDAIVFTGNLHNLGQKHVYIINRGEDAEDGGDGADGQENTSAALGGSGGSGGSGGKTGTLYGGHDGKDGRNGGAGGRAQNIFDNIPGGNGLSGIAGDAAGSGLTLYGYDGGGGGNGEGGTAGNSGGGTDPGTGGGSSSSSSGGASTQGKTKIQHCDPHLVTTFRDVYGTATGATPISASAGAGSGASGGGGGASTGETQGEPVTLGGGAGAGGGGAGGSGGTVMVCARVIKSEITGTTTSIPILHLDAKGGDGGDGGDGGNRVEQSYGE